MSTTRITGALGLDALDVSLKSLPDKHFRVIVIGGLIVLSAALWLVRFDGGPGSLRRFDAWDYAQMGRNLFEGDGLTTDQIFPRYTTYYHEQGWTDTAWPNLHRPPLATILMGLTLWLTGNSLWGMALFSAIGFALCIAAVYLFTERWFGRRVAALAVCLFAATTEIRTFGTNGMTETTSIFLRLTALVLIERAASRIPAAVLLGAVLGLAQLLRTDSAVYILLCLAFMIWLGKSKAVKPVLVCVATMIVVMLPWMIRNVQLTGSPTFSFSNSRNILLDIDFSNYDPDLMLHAPMSLGDMDEHSDELGMTYRQYVYKKFARNITSTTPYGYLWHYGAEPKWLLLFAPVGMLLAKSRRRIELSVLILLMFVGHLVVLSIFQFDFRFFVPFVPFVLAFSLHGILQCFGYMRLPKAVTNVFCVVMLGLAAHAAAEPAAPNEFKILTSHYEVLFPQVESLTSPDAVIASDISYHCCWYTGRRCVRLPLNPPDLLEMDDKYLHVDAVLLGPRVTAHINAIHPEDLPDDKKYINYRFLSEDAEFNRRFPTRLEPVKDFYLYLRSR